MSKLTTREKIVEAATDRFHALGYTACGVQEIVDAANVPKGSFYNHFKAKELLAMEVLDRYWESLRVDMLADKSVPPLARIRSHFEFVASLYADCGYDRGCLLGKFVHELSDETPLIRQDVVTEITRWNDMLADAIREGQADGSITTMMKAEELARFILNGWCGAGASMQILKSNEPLETFFTVTFSILQPKG